MLNDRVRLAGVFATFLLVAALGSSSVTLPAPSATSPVAVKGVSHSRDPAPAGIEPRAGVPSVPTGAPLTRAILHGSVPMVPGSESMVPGSEPTAPSESASSAVSLPEPSSEPSPEPASSSEPAVRSTAAPAAGQPSAEVASSDTSSDSEPTTPEPTTPEAVYVADDGEEIDPDRVRRFLEGRGAPLADHAEELVRAGIEHDVDPRLVVGIAVAESAGGERLPPSTHNAWGWSGDGPHGLKAWPSWPAAIDGFTERFGRLYDTDRVDESMAQTYVPPNWRWWLETVTWVMDEI